MKIENCELEVDWVVAAPMVRTEPEPDWVAARDAEVLPAAGFALYSRSNYLSFGSAPPFLADEKHMLFSYFAMLLRSVGDALVDTDVELRAFSDSQARVYDPGKEIRGEEWDPAAPERARRHFRLLLLSLQAGLDATADLVALFLTGLTPGLRLGRAQFSRIESWLERSLPPGALIVTPQRDFLERLYTDLSPLINPVEPERDWLPLMRMLRNKAAHLGDAMFQYMALHDRDGQFYTLKRSGDSSGGSGLGIARGEGSSQAAGVRMSSAAWGRAWLTASRPGVNFRGWARRVAPSGRGGQLAGCEASARGGRSGAGCRVRCTTVRCPGAPTTPTTGRAGPGWWWQTARRCRCGDAAAGRMR
jgi:hypothetical protein